MRVCVGRSLLILFFYIGCWMGYLAPQVWGAPRTASDAKSCRRQNNRSLASLTLTKRFGACVRASHGKGFRQ